VRQQHGRLHIVEGKPCGQDDDVGGARYAQRIGRGVRRRVDDHQVEFSRVADGMLDGAESLDRNYRLEDAGALGPAAPPAGFASLWKRVRGAHESEDQSGHPSHKGLLECGSGSFYRVGTPGREGDVSQF
jgi:hypothetical protein